MTISFTMCRLTNTYPLRNRVLVMINTSYNSLNRYNRELLTIIYKVDELHRCTLSTTDYFSKKNVEELIEIRLKLGMVGGTSCYKIQVKYHRPAIAICRDLGFKWHSKLSIWYLDRSAADIAQIRHRFEGFKVIEDLQPSQRLSPLHPMHQQFINDFVVYMKQRRYSANTITTYEESVIVFLRFFANEDVSTMTNEHIERFNYEYIVANRYSISYQNQVVNALKLFFLTISKRKIIIANIERPRKEYKLPHVFSKEDVKKLLHCVRNRKHKCMLSIIYACGLRRSEVLNLKLTDIDGKRQVIWIRSSKGNKDRMIPISPKLLTMLQEYYKEYRPKVYLFEGQTQSERYSEGSLQQLFKAALKSAGLTPNGTLHWLRHSYATHLLEAGTNLRIIQELLGHNSSRTTEIYTHVSKQSIENIRSPFDDL